MSERGSFVTEYIYCDKCLEVVRSTLLSHGEFIFHIETKFPIIAGKVRGMYPGEEIDMFRDVLIPKLEAVICHELRIAVLADKGEEIFKISPDVTD